MFRFYVDKKIDNSFELSKDTLKHIMVARVQKKDFICVYEQKFYVCTLQGEVAIIKEEFKENHEFDKEVILAAGFINVKRFEFLIQKATELGATRLIPVISDNTSTKLPSNLEKKLERWNDIAINAAEQSFRNKPMVVDPQMDFKDVLTIDMENKYIAHEKAQQDTDSLYQQGSIFLIGPEGGFTSEEVDLANTNGFKTISLGKRILRAETASMFVLSRIKQ